MSEVGPLRALSKADGAEKGFAVTAKMLGGTCGAPFDAAVGELPPTPAAARSHGSIPASAKT